jgi:hypothetical protein
VPRAVVGEKVPPDKEPEVPEEMEEPQAPEVEQLTFGMIEPVNKSTPQMQKRKPRKTHATRKQIVKTTPRKARVVKAEQATLITKPTPSEKKVQTTKAGRHKSPKATQARGRKSIAKRGKPRVNPSITSSTKQKHTANASTPGLREKAPASKEKKSKLKASKPSFSTKAAVSKEKKPKAGRPRLVKAKDTKPKGITKRKSKPATKSAAIKHTTQKLPQTRDTGKSGFLKTTVKLPTGWKPLPKKKSPTKRSTKSTNPKR